MPRAPRTIPAGPRYRNEDTLLRRHGVHIPRHTLCEWTLLASDWLAIIYREIQYEQRRCPYRQIDETPIRYLEPSTGTAQLGYL